MARSTTARTARTAATKARTAPARVKKKSAAPARTRAAKRATPRRTVSARAAPSGAAVKKKGTTKKRTAHRAPRRTRASAARRGGAYARARKIRRGAVRSIPIRITAAPPEKCFWVHDGPVLSSIADLSRVLKVMPPAQFFHHVNSEKNDFARWVEDVFGETMLARRLRRTKTRAGAYRVVQSFVALHR